MFIRMYNCEAGGGGRLGHKSGVKEKLSETDISLWKESYIRYEREDTDRYLCTLQRKK